MSDFTEAVERNLKGCEAFSVGACPGCEACGLFKPSRNTKKKRDGYERAFDRANESCFSWSPCESCGSSLGGDRHPAHFLLEGWEKLPKEERKIHHCLVCTDCVMYHANGDEPEDWQG